ncbi:EAL domain-containing protein [Sphingomonas ginsenosidivorax]|uniref:EAL domain-containing protein n=1 Tax=Sphingomonas ginsenosidivorax TaxID=862135 RepID=A0A5C6UC19_9SPHN|nr:EAL domain-containing protein [Sphingomonas ginsenosidivorax]TXC69656.1 EAL domain-containing protein [Sphingomonas ginsenosidivorax]
MVRQFGAWLRFATDPGIVIAQYGELRRQNPMLYALLVITALAVSVTHHAYAPTWLTVGGTGLLIAVCVARMIYWLAFAEQVETITVERARSVLRRTMVSAAVAASAFLVWAALLDQYGGPLEHARIAVFTAVTVIGCIFCLVYVPQVALLVHVIVTVSVLAYYLWLGDAVMIAIAFNFMLVTSVTLRVLFTSFDRFAELIRSQASLAAQQSEAERLGLDNARLALTDVLTGLPNRRYFFARLDEVLREHQATGQRFAVGVFDLDRFKPINDTYGHIVGDRLLVEVGRRLADFTRQDAIIARLGGDEFGLIVQSDIADVGATGQRICNLLSQPFEINDNRLTIGCSGGLAIYPDAGTTANALFDRSDYALYNVKSQRRGGCALFSSEQEMRIRSDRAAEAALQSADLHAELHVVFQPLMCLDTMTIVGVEALGRWTSPLVGVVAPDRFVAMAERVGLINQITLILFRKTLASLAVLPRAIGLSFNLSAHDIVSTETVDQLIDAIEQEGADPSRITFELTETALMRNFDAAIIAIDRLRALGIRIALDDFGTGYSSLSSLHRLPLDKVKVDRSFVARMDDDPGSKIITAILGLCTTLHLTCIIEGIETERQFREVRRLGYRIGQGYLLGSAMTMPALLSWLARGSGGNRYACPTPVEREPGGEGMRPAPPSLRSRRARPRRQSTPDLSTT